MNKKVLALIIVMLPVLMMAKLPELLSFGAPVSTTGAPDEVNCSTSGCHDGFSVNGGNANLTFSVGNNISEYIPGQTYPVTVTISEPGVTRFGFQLVALKNADSLNAGDLVITDVNRTQIITNPIELTDRKYITYTYEGTVPFSSGMGQWTFNWTAPGQNVGPVTLYVASVSANDDNTDGGDHVYTLSKTLTPNLSSAVNQNEKFNITADVFPNPMSKELNVKFNLERASIVECELYDVQGKLVKVLFEEEITSGLKTIDMDVLNGVYFLKFKMDDKEKITKIIVQ